ncbi:FAD-dependent oxidoreductase [Phaeobacter sp. J2-8]|nr:FAD-dependent oxidoreductase [Phaeobacter sp. J2-8]
MSAAIEARRHGAEVQVYDNRPEPGGNIYAALGSCRAHRQDVWSALGSSYEDGGPLLDAFLSCGAVFRPRTSLWHLDNDGILALKGPEGTRTDTADAIILATGAQERPMPVPGCTLPRVMGVGAAQILLKTSGVVPNGPIFIVGSGPLPLLYAWQVARMGGRIAGFVVPNGANLRLSAFVDIQGILAGWGYLTKGLAYQVDLLRRRSLIYRNARDIEIIGEIHAEYLRFTTGKQHKIKVGTVLLHDGVIPSIHPAAAAGLPIPYTPAQDAWRAESAGNIHVAGDLAGIIGAKGAALSGQIAAQTALGQTNSNASAKLNKERAFRRLMDAAYPPAQLAAIAPNTTEICRCEMVNAGAIRQAATELGPDPNRIKSTLRIGMGPCQGRMCAKSLQSIVARETGTSPDDIGLHRLRSPITTITLGELAGLKE